VTAAASARSQQPDAAESGPTGAVSPGGAAALFDTHLHLDLKDYERDREAVIERARSAGVRFMVNVGFDLKTTRGSIALAEKYDFIHASAGLHPHDAKLWNHAFEGELEDLARHPRVVAIGETGLDFYRDLSPRGDQVRAFRGQIRLAKRLGLPLVIHNRDALDEVLSVIDEEGAGEVGGVMHCFPGDAAYARDVVDRGFHIGIGGSITFEKNGRLAEVARTIPRRRLLLETDAPWQTPQAHKGQGRRRNEPAFIMSVAEAVASATGMTYDDVARQTTGNAMRFFGIEAPRPSIAYEMWGNLYLNITNRCTNECEFCIRYQTDVLWGYNLRLDREPTAAEILSAIGDPTRYAEVVFCGYGEPTVRLDVVLEVGRAVRAAGGRVRLDTNGHANLIWNRNVAPELADAVDAVSVSLNAESAEVYERICKPSFGTRTYDHVKAFIRECVKAGLEVTASVVDVPGIDIEAARAAATGLGAKFRVRGG
jgi:TatD DNase family protein